MLTPLTAKENIIYVKLFTSIYQGTLRGNSHGLLVFTNLLAHADSEGYVDIHPRAIAEEIGLTVDQVRAALVMLEDVDAESRTPDEQGRRLLRVDEHRSWGWQIVNYLKYRKIKSADDRREQNREAQKRFRDKHSKQPSAPSAHAEAEAEAYAKGKKEKTGARAPSLPRPDDVSEQVWSDWVQLRKAKRATVSPTVLDEARKEAGKAGLTLERFLTVWCARGSQGLQAEWLKPEERGRVSGETPYQRSMRERVAEFSPMAARKAPGASAPFDFIDEVKDVPSITGR